MRRDEYMGHGGSKRGPRANRRKDAGTRDEESRERRTSGRIRTRKRGSKEQQEAEAKEERGRNREGQGGQATKSGMPNEGKGQEWARRAEDEEMKKRESDSGEREARSRG